MSRENPADAAWARYYANHPEVAASSGEASGRQPNCLCDLCITPERLAEIETLRARRDRAWVRVARVDSTRWDLTKYEHADDAYRNAAGSRYVKGN